MNCKHGHDLYCAACENDSMSFDRPENQPPDFFDYRIKCSKGDWLAATGFMSVDRALRWIMNFNVALYTDKSLQRKDFYIEGRNHEGWQKLSSKDLPDPIKEGANQ